MIQGHRTRMIRWREPSRAGSAIFVWDFTQQSPGALVLPTGLSFARASSGHTVQTGDSTIVTSGITSNDIGRIGRLATAHSYGLFIEPARTNSCRHSRSMNAAPGASSGSVSYTTGRTSPDGTTNAIRGQIGSGAYANYDTVPSPGTFASNTRMVLSAWVKKGAGSGAYQFNAAHTGTTGAAAGGTAGAGWGRASSASFVYPTGTACYPVGWDGRANTTLGSSAGARDCEIDFVQIEAGGYATSAIVTSGGSTATRAAERLTIDRATQATVNGRLGFHVRFRALAAPTEMDSSAEGQILLGVGSTCYVWISPSSRYILLGDGGSKYSQTANSVITWARGDLVEMVMEIGNGVSAFRWRINGGSVNTAAFTARNDSLDPIVPSSGLDVLCAGTSWHTPAVLEQATLFVPGRGPF